MSRQPTDARTVREAWRVEGRTFQNVIDRRWVSAPPRRVLVSAHDCRCWASRSGGLRGVVRAGCWVQLRGSLAGRIAGEEIPPSGGIRRRSSVRARCRGSASCGRCPYSLSRSLRRARGFVLADLRSFPSPEPPPAVTPAREAHPLWTGSASPSLRVAANELWRSSPWLDATDTPGRRPQSLAAVRGTRVDKMVLGTSGCSRGTMPASRPPWTMRWNSPCNWRFTGLTMMRAGPARMLFLTTAMTKPGQAPPGVPRPLGGAVVAQRRPSSVSKPQDLPRRRARSLA